MPKDPIAAGHMVAGRYRLVKRLGEGGMGAVWVAEDMTLRSQVALKLLHGEVQQSEDGLKRFLREAQAAARLRSPHVVQILEHGVDEDVPFIAMELLEGESLATRLARLSTLSLGQTARIVTHVARAISKAHDAGIVHRDLKPDNIFIVHNDDEEIVKVLDFGIAKMEQHLAEPSAKISTQEGSLLGTPYYMSPEQVRGAGVDWRSDLWSLAMIAFECLCGRLPFEGRSVGDILVLICSEPLPVPSTLRPLPPSFDAWFTKAATRNVEGRFQSAKEMADALRAIVGDESRTPMPGDSGPVQRVSISNEARTLDADSVRNLEAARTVSASGTMSGASSAVAPSPRSSARLFVGLAALLGIGAVVTWVAFHNGASRVASPQASVSVAPAQIANTPPVATNVTPSVSQATAAVLASASASAPASASARVRTTAPTRTAPHASQSDELAF
jgi:serine/threonine protein kinase